MFLLICFFSPTSFLTLVFQSHCFKGSVPASWQCGCPGPWGSSSVSHFCVHTEFLLPISWDTWMCKCPKVQDKCKLLLFPWWFQPQQMEVLGRNSSLGEGQSGSTAAQEILLASAGTVSFSLSREIAEVHQICCCSFSLLPGRLLCFAVTDISL